MGKTVIEYSEIYLKWLVYKYPKDEIKRNTSLIVKPGQIVVLVHNGKIADIYQPGEYDLNNESMPRLASLGQTFGIVKSVIRTDIYFINTTIFLNNGWGTKDPVIRRDEELNIVRLTAFGDYSFCIEDPSLFITQVFGTRMIGRETHETMQYISNLISQYIAIALAECNYSIMDMSLHYRDIAELLKSDVNKKLIDLGLKVTDLLVENIGTTVTVSKAIDEYSEMNLAKKDFDSYERFQKVKAMREGVSTPGNAMAVEIGSVLGRTVAEIVDVD